MFLPDPWNPESDAAYCLETHGVHSRPSWCLDYFGGWNPMVDFKDVTNVIFSNGSLDPWRIGGVLKQPSDPKKTGTIVIYIEGSAHHFDLRAENPADPKSVTDARATEKQYIKQYISEYNKARDAKTVAE